MTRPYTLLIVPWHENGLLHTDSFSQEKPSDEWGRESGQGIAAQMLPIADPHRFGELQPLRAERFFRELNTIKGGIVRPKLKIERDLLLKLRVTVADDAWDVISIFGPEPLDAHGSHAVEHPEFEWLALNAGR